MLSFELEKLISSLSSSEKKLFKSHCDKQNGSKDYVLLYHLAVNKKRTDTLTWEERFRKKYPSKSFENSLNYLYKVIMDILLQVRTEQDKWYQQYNSLMKARLCFERSLPDRAFRELKKAQHLASALENHSMIYQSARMELNALAGIGFSGLSEKELINKQMKAEHTLASLRKIQEHYSLFELLNHRLVRSDQWINGKNNKQVNDLILSELTIFSRSTKTQYESYKLHLLFQSFFFIYTGEYQSALNIFQELNSLIESNEANWNFPPYDYLSNLDGILDSLRSIGYYDEMGLFIEKIKGLASRSYPEHFKNLCLLTAAIYQLNMSLGKGALQNAKDTLTRFYAANQFLPLSGDYEKRLEFLFFEALTYFQLKSWVKVTKCLNIFFSTSKIATQLPVYRSARLLSILLNYELGETDFLPYEIRSYKRAFSKYGKSYKSEKLVFKVIMANPKRQNKIASRKAKASIQETLKEIKADKKELSLSKYYDFAQWTWEKYS